MSHTPRLSSGYVFKRYLNAKRLREFGGPPPITGLQYYFAEIKPIPADTVQPPPSTERAEFLDRLNVSGSDGFEVGHLPMDSIDGTLIVSNGIGGLFSTVCPFCLYLNLNFDGLFNTTPSGEFFVQLGFVDDDVNLVPTVITFTEPIAAFGCYFTDIGDFGGNLTATLNKTGGGSEVYVLPTTGAETGFLVFWGFVDNSGQLYDSISLISDDTSEAVAMDDVVIAKLSQVIV